MIEFKEQGVYGDEDTPDITGVNSPFFGTREIEVDIIPARNELGEINSGMVFWYTETDIPYSFVRCYISFDGENYNAHKNYQRICPVYKLKDDNLKIIYIRQYMFSHLAELFPERYFNMKKFILRLSNKHDVCFDIDLKEVVWDEKD